MNVVSIQASDIIAAMAKGTHGGARRNSGPKPKPVEEHRRNRIMLNLNDSEHDLLSKAAGGESLSNYARKALIWHLSRRLRSGRSPRAEILATSSLVVV